jgi:type IV secretion system protein VirB10
MTVADTASAPDAPAAQPAATTVDATLIDAAPAVAQPERPWGMILGIGGAVLLGVLVFANLVGGQLRRSAETGAVQLAGGGAPDPTLGAEPPAPPDLFPPPPFDPYAAQAAAPATPAPAVLPPPEPAATTWMAPPPPPPPPAVAEYRPPPLAPSPPAPTRQAADPNQRLRSPALIVDLSTPPPPVPAATPDTAGVGAGAAGDDAFAARVGAADVTPARARQLRNPETTVPQGAMIAAVLETAINSDLPGFVRAVVSRDVTGFDGSTILIPRGSRLVGQYRSEVALGQSRAFVVWTRLLRPDGVSIQLASPGTDPLGRAGLDGKVDRHFWQRFGPGLLTTAITAALQGGNRTNQLVIGTAQTVPAATLGGAGGEAIKPTVTVRQGTAIQVFVARDLDFSVRGSATAAAAPGDMNP